MHQMRAVIFGAGGLLGQALAAELPAAGYTVVGALRGRADGDIAEPALVSAALDRWRPEVVFNSAAWTDVDGAEDHQAEAFRANAEGPETLASACRTSGAALVHYSTDFVYDGEREAPYDESVPASPLSLYGASKLEGENRVRVSLSQAYVVRVGGLYGRGGRNFPSTVLRRLRAGEVIRADNERRISPTWAVAVARLSAGLARTGKFGLYHGTAQGETTWVEFARFVAGAIGQPDARIEAVPGSSLKLKAVRPRRAVLVSHRLAEAGLTSPSWQDQAREYLRTESA
jgi:dTDP-4-dehydrorhamnose reductase